MSARTERKAVAAINKIQKDVSTAQTKFLQTTLMNLSPVMITTDKTRGQETQIHWLAINVGIIAVPSPESKDGYESLWQVWPLISSPNHNLVVWLSRRQTTSPASFWKTNFFYSFSRKLKYALIKSAYECLIDRTQDVCSCRDRLPEYPSDKTQRADKIRTIEAWPSLAHQRNLTTLRF